jgi:hypothetical protein
MNEPKLAEVEGASAQAEMENLARSSAPNPSCSVNDIADN